MTPTDRRDATQPTQRGHFERPLPVYLTDVHEVAVKMSRGLPPRRRLVHLVSLALLSVALGANSVHDILWSAGDRLGRWAHRR
jgi:hypothetical protein